VRVEEGDGICVARIARGRVDVVQGVLGVGLGAVLGEVEGLVVLELVRRRLEEEGWLCALVLWLGGSCGNRG
jgi:hypothetical protein